MQLYEIFGWLAVTANITYTCLGIPVQIHKNYKRKSTKGLSLFMIIFMSLTLLLWSTYAWLKTPKDFFIIGSNIPGFLCTLVLISQFWIYREKGKNI